ncbi:hypothetical protein LQ938_09625 [Microbacterium sp. cx-55]|uniref:hypothetical protein n=1 Tax=Microbacterium sp. cx-55 TaxID=2875948 RepID=UPI001CC15B24|nr:hypothetical protein [Microbacterium sp. cx-55]MBZ4485979.1 hypothetical protein [Microbacterium sp. cx-55]UGB34147.1 hypothetical protein LQ938_09625 [Microbacterium sp. cx-55]
MTNMIGHLQPREVLTLLRGASQYAHAALEARTNDDARALQDAARGFEDLVWQFASIRVIDGPDLGEQFRVGEVAHLVRSEPRGAWSVYTPDGEVYNLGGGFGRDGRGGFGPGVALAKTREHVLLTAAVSEAAA